MVLGLVSRIHTQIPVARRSLYLAVKVHQEKSPDIGESARVQEFRKPKSKSSNKFLKYGAPFLLLVIGGSFGLKEFAQLRYEFSKNKTLTPDEAAKFGIKMKPREEVTLETEYEKTKKININDWEQKRGPRPWEEQEGQSAAKIVH